MISKELAEILTKRNQSIELSMMEAQFVQDMLRKGMKTADIAEKIIKHRLPSGTAAYIHNLAVYYPEVAKYLFEVERIDGLITNVLEWIAEGWGFEHPPSPEQLAASLLMEATTQDQCVENGESCSSYPERLRETAFQILLLAGHKFQIQQKAIDRIIEKLQNLDWTDES